MQQAAERSRNWVRRVQEGDGTAEAELISHYSRGVRLLLLNRTGNLELAKDLSQDTFVVVLRRMRAGELQNPESLSAFIRQVAVNISIQHFRKEKRYVSDSDGIIELNVSHRDYKADGLDRRSLRATLEQTLDQMAVARDREILRRFYLCEEEKAHICGDMHLSATHFDRVLYRARQRMREMIDENKGLRSILFGSLFDG